MTRPPRAPLSSSSVAGTAGGPYRSRWMVGSSFQVASGPWSFLASKDQQGGGNEYSAMSTFFFQVGYVVAIALILMSRSLAPAVLALTAASGEIR